MAIELNYEDLKGLAKAGMPGAVKVGTGPGQVESGQDLMQMISGILDRVNSTMENAKEMINLFRGMNPAPQSGNPGPGQPAQAYKPQPSLAQQLHRILNVAYSAYGDITVVELIQGVLQQYGNTKLSAALKALERL